MEINTVWITLRGPRDGDAGLCEICHYTVADGFVQLCTEQGKPRGKKVKLNGDDPRTIAGRLMHDSLATRKDGGFNRPLDYPSTGWR